ncbi:alpha/beta hydrolase [Methylobacterium sp. J-048]|uniref:alpha/beta fold hydrolase n=1 Tax=Methylobacterium sp. J-048 TaxID=2836635 RepID=UPI001FB96562|nr:alpha/beta hydrolase [Methylobacterium sp. J-048]MCJ2057162.1 alpha/beta hydrolase [Methylobacterium sp. J-048]
MASIPTNLGPIFVDDQGSPGEPVALLWPSLFSDHTMWRNQVPAIRAVGWRTLAFDPPGHGQSAGPGRSFTMDECAEAAIQVLDASGVRTPAVILGTSWGGFVAPRIALRAAGRVGGMALFNTSAQPPLPMQWAKATLLTNLMRFGAFDRTVDGIILSSLLSPRTRKLQPQIGEDLLKRLRTWDRRRTNITVRAVLLERDGVLDDLPRITAPALIVSGAEDAILPTRLSRTIAARLPNARHVEVPGAAHLVPLEAPEAANSLILDSLERWQETCR